MKELASGVDALYLSGQAYLPKALLARLEESRLFADRVAARPLRVGIADLRTHAARMGEVPLLSRPRVRPYRFHLEHQAAAGADSAPGRVPALPRTRQAPSVTLKNSCAQRWIDSP